MPWQANACPRMRRSGLERSGGKRGERCCTVRWADGGAQRVVSRMGTAHPHHTTGVSGMASRDVALLWGTRNVLRTSRGRLRRRETRGTFWRWRGRSKQRRRPTTKSQRISGGFVRTSDCM